ESTRLCAGLPVRQQHACGLTAPSCAGTNEGRSPQPKKLRLEAATSKALVSLLRAWFQFTVGSRYYLVDHVVPESARGQKRVDLALPFARFERFPAPQLARDRASRSLALALRVQVPKCRI